MKKLLFATILLLGGLCAFGQNKAPANLVDVVVTNFTVIDMSRGLYVAPTSRTFNTAQHAFDAIDDKLGDMMLNSDDWDYLLGGTNTGYVYPQPVADWIDENWGIPTNGWSNLAPTNFFNVAGETTAADALNWIDANWVRTAADVGLVTDNFQFVGAAMTDFWCPPTNVQRFADWIDNYGQYVESTNWQRLGASSWPTNLPWLPISAVLEWLDTNAMWGTNIVGHTYSGGQWSDRRSVGFQGGRKSESGSVFQESASSGWITPTNVMDHSSVLDGGGTVSVSPVNEVGSAFEIPVVGVYNVSGQSVMVYTNNTADPVTLGIGVLYHKIDGYAPPITLAQHSTIVGTGEVANVSLNFASTQVFSTNYYLKLRVRCTATNGWSEERGPYLSSVFYSAFLVSR